MWKGNSGLALVFSLCIFLNWNGDVKGEVLVSRIDSDPTPSQPSTMSTPAAPSTVQPSSSKLPIDVLTLKPKFKGPERNCASAFDPCYFPRSICCKWQTDCSWDMTRADCKDDKEDNFCCKHM